jgi:hypothetical protein
LIRQLESALAELPILDDCYCVEWSYAKAVLVRKILARVLADRVQLGQFSVERSVCFARAIFFESPQSLLGMVPRPIEKTELR